MQNQQWPQAISSLTDFIVRIEIPDSYGTGFLVAYANNDKGDKCIIATALHVVEHAHKWNEIIRIVHHSSRKQITLSASNRDVMTNSKNDLALIICDRGLIPFPENLPAVPNPSMILQPGWKVGWCGFPNMMAENLCFFSGHVSSLLEGGNYLVDGVAINGVSGCPAFIYKDNSATIIGVVSAYIPNFATGQSLPGMSVIRNVAPIIELFKKKQEEKNNEPPGSTIEKEKD